MGKFRIRVKLQGFELEVDGDREDIPAITAVVQHQLGGLVQPPEFDPEPNLPGVGQMLNVTPATSKKGGSRKRSSPPKANGDAGVSNVIDFPHDAGKFGNPKQTWSVAQKCIWLLSVIDGIKGIKEATAPQLTATYNQQFRAAGKLHPPNVPRDLNSAKMSSLSPVGEDKGCWFLTDAGKTQAQELVKEGLGS
jgi:hypothetical protein